MRHIIRHRTLSVSMRHSLSRVARCIRYALSIMGPGSFVHAWIDDEERPAVEVMDSARFSRDFELNSSDYAALRLYFRQWSRRED